MKIEERSALLVIDIQQEDFKDNISIHRKCRDALPLSKRFMGAFAGALPSLCEGVHPCISVRLPI